MVDDMLFKAEDLDVDPFFWSLFLQSLFFIY